MRLKLYALCTKKKKKKKKKIRAMKVRTNINSYKHIPTYTSEYVPIQRNMHS